MLFSAMGGYYVLFLYLLESNILFSAQILRIVLNYVQFLVLFNVKTADSSSYSLSQVPTEPELKTLNADDNVQEL